MIPRSRYVTAAVTCTIVIASAACGGHGDERRIDTSSASNDAVVPVPVPAPTPIAPVDSARLVPAVPAPDTAGQWLFAATPDEDAIRASTSENLLIRQFGAANVKRDSLDVGEGEMTEGDVLFPSDSARRVEIFWADSTARTRISMLRLRGSHSVWRVAPGVSLGTTLLELEKLNGRPFMLAGFGWDYSGTVMSWDGGALDSLWERGTSARGHVGLRLDYPPGRPRSERVLSQVLGDHEYSSSLPAMRAINPVVYELFVTPR
jgi:hypothetical protein